MVQQGAIVRIGRGRFLVSKKRYFKPDISKNIENLFLKIKKEFPYISICIWNTSMLNEFMKHQPNSFYTIIEIDKEAVESVFYFLRDLKLPVFIEPTQDIIDKYFTNKKDIYIVKQLVTESPLQEVNSTATCTLEKMLVDIFSDEVIFSAQQGAEMRTIFQEAFERYAINENRLLRYANRRRKKDQIISYLDLLAN